MHMLYTFCAGRVMGILAQMKRLTLRILRLFAIAYVAFLLLVAGCQSRLIYHPRVSAEPVLMEQAKEARIEPWREASGALIGWKMAAPRAKARLLVFHGNAGDAVVRAQYLHTFHALGWEPYVMEYPGYGARPGSPGMSAFFAAGRAAIATVRAADERPLYLLGESIGAGTACAMAGEHPEEISGVLLVVPFARLAEVAQRVMPWLPVRLLLRDTYDNVAALGKYHGPVAFVVAANDEVVGVEQGRKLHESYAGPKLLIELPETTHNGFGTGPEMSWVRKADAFLRR